MVGEGDYALTGSIERMMSGVDVGYEAERKNLGGDEVERRSRR
jgi:hypothetical protein